MKNDNKLNKEEYNWLKNQREYLLEENRMLLRFQKQALDGEIESLIYTPREEIINTYVQYRKENVDEIMQIDEELLKYAQSGWCK